MIEIFVFILCLIFTLISYVLLNSVTFYRFINGKHKLKYENYIVVVTGCDTGFGNMLSLSLSKLGFFVVSLVLTKEGYDDLNDKVGLALIGDVTKQTDVDNLGKSIQNLVIERNLSLWAVVNNAGIGNGAYIDWTPLEIYQKVMDVNYFGIIRVIKATLQQLKKTKYSRIINLSSIAGHIGGPLLGAYSGSKFAVEGLGKSIRGELKYFNIHVVNINPAFMKTPIIQKAFAQAHELFNSLPEEVRDQYRPDFLNGPLQMANMTSENPMLVVNEIIEVITDRNPIFSHFVGLGATAFRIMNMIPYPIQEMINENSPIAENPLKPNLK